MANKFDSIARQSISKEKSDDLLKKTLAPVNCKILAVPKVNSEIWAQLPSNIKTNDLKSQRLQQATLGGLIGVAKAADTISKFYSQMPKEVAAATLTSLMDAAVKLSLVNSEMSIKRRLDIKPALSFEYAGICASKEAVGEFLFGENLSDALKTTKATSNIMKNISKDRASRRPVPYNRNKGSNNLNWRGRYVSRGGHRGRGHRFSNIPQKPYNQ